jgi:hypothetical protein
MAEGLTRYDELQPGEMYMKCTDLQVHADGIVDDGEPEPEQARGGSMRVCSNPDPRLGWESRRVRVRAYRHVRQRRLSIKIGEKQR